MPCDRCDLMFGAARLGELAGGGLAQAMRRAVLQVSGIAFCANGCKLSALV